MKIVLSNFATTWIFYKF